MTPQSAKAKGRNLQKAVCEALYKSFKQYGLEPDDFLSRSMGANGVDVILSPAARKLLGDLAIECKNQQALNVMAVFQEHMKKYPKSLALLVHKKNHTEVLVTMTLQQFVDVLKKGVNESTTVPAL